MKRHKGMRNNAPEYCPSADMKRIKRRIFLRKNPPRLQVTKEMLNRMYGKFAVPLTAALDEAREPLQIWPKLKEPNFWQIAVRFVKLVVRRCSAAVLKRGAN